MEKIGGNSGSSPQSCFSIVLLQSGNSPSPPLAASGSWSLQQGEEEILLEAFSRLQREFSNLPPIVAPRDPDRAESVCGIFRSVGFCVHPLKDLGRVAPVTRSDVVAVDTIGILRRLYALADMAFLGGSLVRTGGQNPLEPAA